MSAFAQVGNIRLHYQIDSANHALPWLVLSNSLGTDLSMWEPQIAALTAHFQVLRYDTRGHGQSEVPAGEYSVEQLGQDVIGLLDALGIEEASFCGLSMGGMTGMWLGVHQPERIRRLALCNTAALIGTPEMWNGRIATVLANGMDAVAAAVTARWFTPGFLQRAPQVVAALAQKMAATIPQGYAACCAAVRDMDQRGAIASISLSTLVIAGAHDPATPAAEGRFVASQIAGALYVELDAAHLSNQEQPEAFTQALLDFLTRPH